MKKIVYLLIIIGLLSSCESEKIKAFKSSKLELRQLVKETEVKKQASGCFFLISGGYSSSEQNVTTIKVFAKVENRFRLIEIPIKDVRINIDNSLTKPNIEIEYTCQVRNQPSSDEELINLLWVNKIFVINCPEIYLPEKLLPISL